MSENELTVNVYGANWCSDCRRTKKYLGEQRIHYNWFDIEKPGMEGEKALKFVYEANKEVLGKAKRKIPAVEIIRNEQRVILVEPSNFELAESLGYSKEASKKFYHAIIVGAGPAGLTASIYLARDGYDVLVIEKSTVGGQAFITNRLDNFPGFPEGITGSDFANNIRKQAERFGVEILAPQNVIGIKPCHEGGSFEGCKFKVVELQNGEEFSCTTVLIATGSEYRQIVVSGADDLLGVGLHYCATCDGFFYKGKEIFVIGGGNSAFEEALFLQEKFARKTTILIRGNKARASPVLREKVKKLGIDVWYDKEIIELVGEKKLQKVVVLDKKTDITQEYYPDGIFVFIGLSPNTNFLKDTLILDSQGFIITTNLQSSAKGIFAAGDCRKGSIKQAVSAAGEGAAAAIMMREYLQLE